MVHISQDHGIAPRHVLVMLFPLVFARRPAGLYLPERSLSPTQVRLRLPYMLRTHFVPWSYNHGNLMQSVVHSMWLAKIPAVLCRDSVSSFPPTRPDYTIVSPPDFPLFRGKSSSLGLELTGSQDSDNLRRARRPSFWPDRVRAEPT